jgi:RHS repeat-associated protein
VTTSEYVYLGDIPIAVLKPGTPTQIYYIFSDHLNTPRVVTNSANISQIRWRWLSEPFGTAPAEDNPMGLGVFTFNLRFPGQYYDAESALHNNYHRDYDPKLGRYVQSDPIGLQGGINTYAYVGSNPLTWIDPDGRQSREGRERPSDRTPRDRPDGPYGPVGQASTDSSKVPTPSVPSTSPVPTTFQACMAKNLADCPLAVVGSCAPICAIAAPSGPGALGCAVGCELSRIQCNYLSGR